MDKLTQTLLQCSKSSINNINVQWWIHFKHDKFRIERWRENPYKDNNTLKTNITNNM